jgi:hypothetical protein
VHLEVKVFERFIHTDECRRGYVLVFIEFEQLDVPVLVDRLLFCGCALHCKKSTG